MAFKKPNIDPLAKDLIQQLLTKEPTLRIGYADIAEIKAHPYFEGICWETLRATEVPVTAPRRPPRIQNFSNSFSATNGVSPLIQIKSPNLS